MKKILIALPSLSGGGAEKVGITYANQLHKLGYDIQLLVFNNTKTLEGEINKNINLKILDNKIRYSLVYYFKIIWSFEPEIIIGTIREVNIISGFYKIIDKRKKIILMEANTLNGLEYNSLIYKFFVLNLMRISYRLSDLIIANSHDTKNDLVNNNIVSKSKINVIGNPVYFEDISILASKTISDDWLNNKKYKVILGAGRLVRQKNFSFLISAFKKIHLKERNSRLIILGSGPLKSELIDHAKKIGINEKCKFINYVDNPYPYFKKAKLFALSSSWEGFGNVIIDALSCGTQIISLNCLGGPKDILNNNTFGELIELDNEEEFVEKSIYLLNNQKFSEKEMKNRAKDYSADQIVLTAMKRLENLE